VHTTRPSRRRGPVRPRTALALAALAGALTLTACGGSDSTADAAADIASDAEELAEAGVDPEVIDALEEAAAAPMPGDGPVADPVEVGGCAGSMPDGVAASAVPAVDCAEPHRTEVYAAVPLDALGADHPGEDAVYEAADPVCDEAFTAYVGVPFLESDLWYRVLQPTPESWADGDRTALCLVFDNDGQQHVGSVRGTAR
jgi:hypothetical protein